MAEGSVVHDAVAALLLGLVEGLVRPFDETLHGIVGTQAGDADGQGDLTDGGLVVAALQFAFGQRFPDLLGDVEGLHPIARLKQYGHFLAAVAGGELAFGKKPLDDAGRVTQYLVSGQMAVAVVDPFEMIQVQQQQEGGFRLGILQYLLNLDVEGPPVEQTGEGVGEGGLLHHFQFRAQLDDFPLGGLEIAAQFLAGLRQRAGFVDDGLQDFRDAVGRLPVQDVGLSFQGVAGCGGPLFGAFQFFQRVSHEVLERVANFFEATGRRIENVFLVKANAQFRGQGLSALNQPVDRLVERRVVSGDVMVAYGIIDWIDRQLEFGQQRQGEAEIFGGLFLGLVVTGNEGNRLIHGIVSLSFFYHQL